MNDKQKMTNEKALELTHNKIGFLLKTAQIPFPFTHPSDVS